MSDISTVLAAVAAGDAAACRAALAANPEVLHSPCARGEDDERVRDDRGRARPRGPPRRATMELSAGVRGPHRAFTLLSAAVMFRNAPVVSACVDATAPHLTPTEVVWLFRDAMDCGAHDVACAVLPAAHDILVLADCVKFAWRAGEAALCARIAQRYMSAAACDGACTRYDESFNTCPPTSIACVLRGNTGSGATQLPLTEWIGVMRAVRGAPSGFCTATDEELMRQWMRRCETAEQFRTAIASATTLRPIMLRAMCDDAVTRVARTAPLDVLEVLLRPDALPITRRTALMAAVTHFDARDVQRLLQRTSSAIRPGKCVSMFGVERECELLRLLRRAACSGQRGVMQCVLQQWPAESLGLVKRVYERYFSGAQSAQPGWWCGVRDIVRFLYAQSPARHDDVLHVLRSAVKPAYLMDDVDTMEFLQRCMLEVHGPMHYALPALRSLHVCDVLAYSAYPAALSYTVQRAARYGLGDALRRVQDAHVRHMTLRYVDRDLLMQHVVPVKTLHWRRRRTLLLKRREARGVQK
uniref:Uncharacterized protein n=1 Tax=viral metagenome TaxID=1070528 RepID=A0A6C0AT17_9ZZZZ